jgi:hypothetical protein
VQPHGIPEPATLAVSPVGPYNYVIDALEKPDALAAIEQVFREVFGRSVSLRFERSAAPEVDRSEPSRPSRIVRHEDLDADPLVQDMIKLFDARAVQLQLDDEAGSV